MQISGVGFISKEDFVAYIFKVVVRKSIYKCYNDPFNSKVQSQKLKYKSKQCY